ncbi:MAG: transcription elongation factor GreA [Clostridia bacterium]|nr:transcription elongation factor GreA [Clostridia bacterium]
MANKQVLLTAEGLKQLEEELDLLKGEKRREIADKIKVARSYGDLSENSEYDDAKNEQAILEARIATIEATLKIAVVIDENEISDQTVHVGSLVKVENVSMGREIEYRIIGSNEANPKENKISDESPVGRALLGKKVGDMVEVEVPAGLLTFKVLEVSK